MGPNLGAGGRARLCTRLILSGCQILLPEFVGTFGSPDSILADERVPDSPKLTQSSRACSGTPILESRQPFVGVSAQPGMNTVGAPQPVRLVNLAVVTLPAHTR